MDNRSRRIAMSLSGVVLCAFSVAVFRIAAMGVDPFQALMTGLNAAVPISFGTLYVLVNGLLLLFSLATDRHLIGIATFINMFLLGYITDYSHRFLLNLFPSPGLGFRIICLCVGIVLICAASSLYMTADLGVSTYDAVAIVMSDKWKIGRFRTIRIATDLVCVVSGALLYYGSGGGSISQVAGVATIITAFFMGPLIELFCSILAKPLLNR